MVMPFSTSELAALLDHEVERAIKRIRQTIVELENDLTLLEAKRKHRNEQIRRRKMNRDT